MVRKKLESPSIKVVERVSQSSELQGLQAQYLGELAKFIALETPQDAIEMRPGRGGRYPYVPIYYAVPWFNTLFGYLWDVVVDDKGVIEEEVEIEEELIPEGLSQKEVGTLRIQRKLEKVKRVIKTPTQVWVQGRFVVNIPGRDIEDWEYHENGTIKRHTITRIHDMAITKSAFGGVDIKYYGEGTDNAGMQIDRADDFKAALADMTKKGASYMGFFSDVYGQREKEEVGPSDGQLNALYKRAKSKGLNEAATISLCKDTMDDLEPGDLNNEQYFKFMKTLLGTKSEPEKFQQEKTGKLAFSSSR